MSAALNSKNLSRTLLASAVIALVVMLIAFLKAWTIAFNSDFAIVGLLAKRFLETGELPLFIGQVGYQGLLIEVPAVALAYKIFGINPYSLNLAPALFSVVLVYLFYRVARESCGKLTASLATLCLVVSSSHWYHQVARTQPNYVETFALGLLLFHLYWSFLKARGDEVKALQRSDYKTIAAFGFVAGFGIYTYGQILYFLIAIALHAAILYLRGIYQRERSPDWWKQALLPRGGGWAQRAATLLTAIIALAWLAMAIAGRYEFRETRIRFLTSPFANFVLLVLSYGLIHAISFVRHYFRVMVLHAKAIGCFFAALVIGYSPKLYYNLVLKLPSIKRTGISGYYADAVRRLGIAFHGNLSFLNLNEHGGLDWILGLSLALCFICFLWHGMKLAWKIITAQREWSAILEIPLITLLPIPVLGLFTLSDGVLDAMSARYTISLWIFYALAVAWCVVSLWNTSSKVGWVWRSASFIFVMLFLANNGIHFYRSVREAPLTTGFEPVIAYMKEKNLRFGYGYFWYAYAINLQTNEELVIDSIDPKYIGYYAPLVAQANEIAYIDKKPYMLNVESESTSIAGQNYRILEKAEFNEMSVFHLKRE